MEELVWRPLTGALLTHAPSTTKIPTANDTPAHFKVALYEAPNPADTIHRSKAVGEPPLLLPFSALLAICDAVSAVGGHKIDPPLRGAGDAGGGVGGGEGGGGCLARHWSDGHAAFTSDYFWVRIGGSAPKKLLMPDTWAT